MVKFTRGLMERVFWWVRRFLPAARVITTITPTPIDNIVIEVIERVVEEGGGD